jgi:hypothetical protein
LLTEEERMTVREFIQRLMDFNMEAEIDFEPTFKDELKP